MTRHQKKTPLPGVSQTLWVPLLSRAQASKDRGDAFFDACAEALVASHTEAYHPVSSPLAQVLVARAQHYDQAARDFLATYPQGQIIQLGCGLDSRYHRLPPHRRGNPQQWWHLDLPEVIALRQKYLPEEQQLPASVTDLEWLLSLAPDTPTLLQAEGVFMYLARRDIHRCFLAWSRYFQQAALVSELTYQHWIPLLRSPLAQKIFQCKMQTQDAVSFQGGLLSPQEPEQWSSRIRYLKHWTYGEAFGLRFLKAASPLWTGHYNLGPLPCL